MAMNRQSKETTDNAIAANRSTVFPQAQDDAKNTGLSDTGNYSETSSKGGSDSESDGSCKGKLTKLAHDYAPSHSDVIIGRGKKCYNHAGNKALRNIVNTYIRKYSTATNKVEKSEIISTVVEQVLSNNGRFIKQDPVTPGIWYEVGSTSLLTREKVAQTFRDALHVNYKSSAQYKNRVRSERNKRKRGVASSPETASQVPGTWKISQLVEMIHGSNLNSTLPGTTAGSNSNHFDLIARNKAIMMAFQPSPQSSPSASPPSIRGPGPLSSQHQPQHNQIQQCNLIHNPPQQLMYIIPQSQQPPCQEQAQNRQLHQEEAPTQNIVACLSSALPAQCFEDDDPFEPTPLQTKKSSYIGYI